MATKDLSRTVIEGGRVGFNQWARRHSHRLVRTRERMALGGGDDWDDVVIARRTPIGRAFADKLSPAERYLAAQVGRPWSKVRSELRDGSVVAAPCSSGSSRRRTSGSVRERG